MGQWWRKWWEDVVRWAGERRAAAGRWRKQAGGRWKRRWQRVRQRARRWVRESLPAWGVLGQVLGGWALVTWAVWEAVPEGWQPVTWKASAGVLMLATVGRRMWVKLLDWGLYLLREADREQEERGRGRGRGRRR